MSNESIRLEVLIPEERIRRRVAELAQEITRDFAGRDPIIVGVLRGAVFFHADLVRRLPPDLRIDYLAVASYDGTDPAGEICLLKDLETPLHGEDVLLVEDIVDTGGTLQYLRRLLEARNPRTLRICSLLSKKARRRVTVEIDYLGFEIPDRFVVGYGLDWNQRYRNLPYVGTLLPDHLPSASK
ncbi:MAG TPA: hypoxanthine phosphoribosyltransferase [Acidobacteriota bacterium]|nr:hypoxanthine phosphoribosyltransferase [Acidobacteriota bacterium]